MSTIIHCEDNFKLVGNFFIPEKIKAAILIAPATGIKQQFYQAFAKYLQTQGFAVLTFDNRGIGASKAPSLRDRNLSLTNWGTLDMTAALEHLKKNIPNVDYHLIGHSAGGQLIGLMNNAKDLKSVFNVGSSSGSIQYARYPFKFKSSFWLNFYIPVSNFIFGHTKSQWVGMGEPLPKYVSKEWSRWCNGKGYVKVDLDSRIKKHYYHELSFDSLWVHATDDEIANTATVQDMIRVYSNINATTLTLSPEDYGYKDIGHMKFFSSTRSQLWSIATNWLNKQ